MNILLFFFLSILRERGGERKRDCYDPDYNLTFSQSISNLLNIWCVLTMVSLSLIKPYCHSSTWANLTVPRVSFWQTVLNVSSHHYFRNVWIFFSSDVINYWYCSAICISFKVAATWICWPPWWSKKSRPSLRFCQAFLFIFPENI